MFIQSILVGSFWLNKTKHNKAAPAAVVVVVVVVVVVEVGGGGGGGLRWSFANTRLTAYFTSSLMFDLVANNEKESNMTLNVLETLNH